MPNKNSGPWTPVGDGWIRRAVPGHGGSSGNGKAWMRMPEDVHLVMAPFQPQAPGIQSPGEYTVAHGIHQMKPTPNQNQKAESLAGPKCLHGVQVARFRGRRPAWLPTKEQEALCLGSGQCWSSSSQTGWGQKHQEPSTLFSATEGNSGTVLGEALYNYSNMSLTEKGSDQQPNNTVIASEKADHARAVPARAERTLLSRQAGRLSSGFCRRGDAGCWKRTGTDCGPQPGGRQIGLQLLLEWPGGGCLHFP